MKSILVSVDFSEGSLNSCKYAVDVIPKNTPVSLWLFHVYADQLIFQPTYDIDGVLVDPMVDFEFFEEMKKIATENLNKLKKEVEDYISEKGITNITVKEVMIQGEPEWLITDICEELTPDVIVMSTHGSGRKGPLEGSMAKRIMGKAKVPVLAVPEDYTDHKLSRILFVTNPDEELQDVDYVKMIMDNMRYLDVQIMITHFKESSGDTDNLKDFLEIFSEEVDDQQISLLEVGSGVPIGKVVKEHQIDVIAFVAHKQNPFKLLFKKVISKKDLFEAGVPVLGLPPEK